MSKKKSDIDYSEVFDELPSLGSSSAKLQGGQSECFIELTFNYPRITSFVNKTSQQQKAFYDKIFYIVKNTFSVACLYESQRTFEFCQSGHVHLHAWLHLKFDHPHVAVGVVADLAKVYLKCLPKRHNLYSDSKMSAQFLRYRSPSICVQYRNINDIERTTKWKQYINKYQ